MKAARQQAIVDLLITHSSLTTETLSKQLQRQQGNYSPRSERAAGAGQSAA
ncbi:hypothetical protein LNQ52_15045 [Klebsiella pneumoniae subsp. pneumoniae]|nr:hypothetical protein [Klebsiella pneumoniae subsp. pneumoniae]